MRPIKTFLLALLVIATGCNGDFRAVEPDTIPHISDRTDPTSKNNPVGHIRIKDTVDLDKIEPVEKDKAITKSEYSNLYCPNPIESIYDNLRISITWDSPNDPSPDTRCGADVDPYITKAGHRWLSESALRDVSPKMDWHPDGELNNWSLDQPRGEQKKTVVSPAISPDTRWAFAVGIVAGCPFEHLGVTKYTITFQVNGDTVKMFERETSMLPEFWTGLVMEGTTIERVVDESTDYIPDYSPQ